MSKSRYAWALVGLLWVVAVLNYVDRQIIFSIFPVLRAEMKLSGLQLGALGTAFLWVYGIISPFAGYLSDRFGRRRIIILSVAVWSAVTWATGHAPNYTQLVVARALMGLSEAFFLPTALAMIAEHHEDKTRSLATGILFSGVYAGMVLAGVGGGWIAERFYWRNAFVWLGGFGCLYAMVLLLTLKESQGGASPRPAAGAGFVRSLARLNAARGYGTLAAVFVGTSIANWIAYTWFPLHAYEALGMGLAEAGFTATFYLQAGSVGGILLGGSLADWWIRRNGRARLLVQCFGLMAAAPFLFLAGSTRSSLFLIAGLLVFGLGRGMYDCNAMPVLSQLVKRDLRATGYGIFNCVGCFAGGLMTAVAGWMKSAMGLSFSFQLAAVTLLASAALLFRVRLGAQHE